MNRRNDVKVVLLLAILTFCLFDFVLHRQRGIFSEFEAVLIQTQWMLPVCLVVWLGAFFLLTFKLNDLPLVALLVIASATYYIGFAKFWTESDAIRFLTGATLGKGTNLFLKGGKQKTESKNILQIEIFLIGLVLLLAFSTFWHLDMTNNFYHGPRWMGLWDNPNIYGMLMGAGLLLAIGLLGAQRQKGEDGGRKAEGRRQNWFLRSLRCLAVRDNLSHNLSGVAPDRAGGARVLPIILFIAALMMAVGLLFSYSRGAWAGTAIGLLYLAKAYGKFKWRWVLVPVLLATVTAIFFWHTPRTAPWYFQRLDLSRGSVQHRLAAWKAGFEIMRDHPFGVGWNKAVETYEKNYSPPEGGAGAIMTNDYLMLGTQLGIPALVCFLAYAGLCFIRTPRFTVKTDGGKQTAEGATLVVDSGFRTLDSTKVASRAGALAMLVAFWFDGGLFKLATAAVFWILLELGTETGAATKELKKA
jgi:O-antigen ligase